MSGLYLLSDSRISWGDQGQISQVFDNSQKLFYSERSADAFGYCGDTTSGVNALSQLVAELNKLKGFRNYPMDRKIEEVSRLLDASFSRYPSVQIVQEPQIIHISRTGAVGFFVHLLERVGGKFLSKPQTIQPGKSQVIASRGSGTAMFNKILVQEEKDQGMASRVPYWAFIELLRRNLDPGTGGPPQAVVIPKKGIPKPLVLSFQNAKYLHGKPVSQSDLIGVEYRDEEFNFVKPSGERFSGASQYRRRPSK